MKKLSLSILIASALLISACDQAQEGMDTNSEVNESIIEHTVETISSSTSDSVKATNETVSDALDSTTEAASNIATETSEMIESTAKKVHEITKDTNTSKLTEKAKEIVTKALEESPSEVQSGTADIDDIKGSATDLMAQ